MSYFSESLGQGLEITVLVVGRWRQANLLDRFIPQC